jgi:hypothetical protein
LVTAIELEEEVLMRRQEVLDPNHPSTLRSMGNLEKSRTMLQNKMPSTAEKNPENDLFDVVS